MNFFLSEEVEIDNEEEEREDEWEIDELEGRYSSHSEVPSTDNQSIIFSYRNLSYLLLFITLPLNDFQLIAYFLNRPLNLRIRSLSLIDN